MAFFISGILLLIVGIIFIIVTKSNKKDDKSYADASHEGKIKAMKSVGVVSLLLGIIAVALSFCASIPTGHTGIPVTFGRVSNYVLDAGINAKLPWQDIVKMDNRVQKESVELSCFSADIQEVKMLYTINFQIRQADAMVIYSTIGKDYYEKVIVPCITESVKAVTAKYTAENLIATRNALALKIEDDLSNKLDGYNIILVSTSIEDMDFTDEFTNAVEAKQVAQQDKLRAETEADQKRIEAKAEADAEVIRAQGEAEAYQKINSSLTGAVLQKMYYEKWNGILPGVIGSDSIVVMPDAQKASTGQEAN